MKQPFKCPECNTKFLSGDSTKQITCPGCSFSGARDSFILLTKKQRVCASCNYKWDEYFPADSEIPSDFTCPKCKTSTESTVLNVEVATKTGYLELTNDGEGKWVGAKNVFELSTGVQTLGREANPPKADILLPTTDGYIGRCHIKIEVKETSNGRIKHLLADCNSVNGTYINGIKLNKGEVIVLTNNDEIKIGHTTFTFHC